jgi:hypothetical protein
LRGTHSLIWEWSQGSIVRWDRGTGSFWLIYIENITHEISWSIHRVYLEQQITKTRATYESSIYFICIFITRSLSTIADKKKNTFIILTLQSWHLKDCSRGCYLDHGRIEIETYEQDLWDDHCLVPSCFKRWCSKYSS